MDDIGALTHQVEYLFLKKIIDGLKNKSINLVDAKKYAKDFLQIEPFTSFEDAYEKVINFVKTNTIFIELTTFMNSYKNEKQDLDKIQRMREHLKNSDIDSALLVAKENA